MDKTRNLFMNLCTSVKYIQDSFLKLSQHDDRQPILLSNPNNVMIIIKYFNLQ